MIINKLKSNRRRRMYVSSLGDQIIGRIKFSQFRYLVNP